MIVTYRPENAKGFQTWEFDPGKIRASRAEMIEKRAKTTWDGWLQEVQSGSMRARRVLLWHLISTDHPGLRWEDTPDFYAGELEIQHTSAELTVMRERTLKAGLPEDQTGPILAALDMELEEARERETAARLGQIDAEDAEDAEGKAPSRSGESSTSGRSPRSSTSRRGTSATA